MSNLIVLKFDNADEAGKVRQALRELEQGGQLTINDAAVVSKDAEGKVHVRNELESGITTGAIGGGVIGLILGAMFPIAGLAIGAAGGALIGKLLDTGVDNKFVKEVTAALTPNTSALFVALKDGDPNVALAVLRPFQGTLYHTTLSSELEQELRNALR